MISKISQFVDLFLYDLKLMDLEDHKKYTGVDNQGILENLIFLFERGKRIILRFPVIPGITNTQKNIAKIKDLLRSSNDSGSKAWNLEIDLLPYHTIAREKYHRFKKNNLLQNIQGLTKESMIPLKNELESIGVKVKIGG
jgi:pyruvate formate lyase activating enzyme